MLSGALWYLPRGAAKFKVSANGEGPVGDFAYLHDGPNGSVWLSDELGLRRVSGSGIPATPVSSHPHKVSKQPRFGNFTFDGAGTLWAASSRGIQRISNASELPIGVSVDPAAGETFTMAQDSAPMSLGKSWWARRVPSGSARTRAWINFDGISSRSWRFTDQRTPVCRRGRGPWLRLDWKPEPASHRGVSRWP